MIKNRLFFQLVSSAVTCANVFVCRSMMPQPVVPSHLLLLVLMFLQLETTRPPPTISTLTLPAHPVHLPMLPPFIMGPLKVVVLLVVALVVPFLVVTLVLVPVEAEAVS